MHSVSTLLLSLYTRHECCVVYWSILYIILATWPAKVCVCVCLCGGVREEEGKGAISFSVLLTVCLECGRLGCSNKFKKVKKPCAGVWIYRMRRVTVPSVRIRNRLLHVCFFCSVGNWFCLIVLSVSALWRVDTDLGLLLCWSITCWESRIIYPQRQTLEVKGWMCENNGKFYCGEPWWTHPRGLNTIQDF